MFECCNGAFAVQVGDEEVSANEITGDRLVSHPVNKEYSEGYERIFGMTMSTGIKWETSQAQVDANRPQDMRPVKCDPQDRLSLSDIESLRLRVESGYRWKADYDRLLDEVKYYLCQRRMK